ncbi:hypothetical protein F4561_000876 [Lipingzhangella halophila]|uniref:Uncharacterized protein n=1 Tax=Lipingzhangella halophila TaxID=1783352 RepID=A0A7W7REN9_9ACTN|nr:DUF6114 domain-containing protein [Lipingzhangella halophila]MBB4930056.1 hypothetical protein [Lipingzhangella halophila]
MSRHGQRPGRGARARVVFRNWRRSRPFWGGLLVTLGGAIIVLAPLAPLPLLIQQGIAGISGYIVGLLLIALGLLAWFQPMQRSFFGIVAILLSLASFVTSNFGGFVIGMLLGLVGGALVFAWVPDRRAPASTQGPEDAVPEPAGGPSDAVDGATAPDTAVEPPEDHDRKDDRKADQSRDGDDGQEPPRIGNGGMLRSIVALPMALALVSPAMVPADEGPGWPWDWFPDDEEESEEPEEPSPDPSSELPEVPSPAPSETGGADGDNDEDADSDSEDQDEDEEDEEEDDSDSECEFGVGDESVASSEEEFLEAVQACQDAQEDDELPEVDSTEAEGDFNAATVPMGLTSDEQTMYGAKFEGVVDYPTAEGTERYLKLSMDSTEFTGAEQWYELGDSRTTLALPGMTFTGDVVIHVTEMHVRILGIPLTFTPDFPPPLLLPVMYVTDLEAKQPLAQANEVVIDGLDQRVE